jgi:hypothetical protein
MYLVCQPVLGESLPDYSAFAALAGALYYQSVNRRQEDWQPFK